MSSQPPWETQIQPGWGGQPPSPEQPQQAPAQPQPSQGGSWNQGAFAPPQPPPATPPPAPPQQGGGQGQFQPPSRPQFPPLVQDQPPSQPQFPQFGQQPAPPQFTPPQMPGMSYRPDAPPPKNNTGRLVAIVLSVVVLVAAAGGVYLYTQRGKSTDNKAQAGTTKSVTGAAATSATSATPSAASGSGSASFPDNSYTSSSAAPPASASSPGGGGASLDSAATDKTPFTPDALVAKNFTDDKHVDYTLKFAGPGPCKVVGDATVQKIISSAPCGQLMAASWIDPDNNRIVVSAMVIPYPDAATAAAIYKKLSATHTGDYSQWCPPAGQPGNDTCAKLAKAGTVTREGKFGSFHRYLLITTAVFTDLRNDDSQKDWLTAAAHGAFQNTLPGQ